jgi:hypothetical protein
MFPPNLPDSALKQVLQELQQVLLMQPLFLYMR